MDINTFNRDDPEDIRDCKSGFNYYRCANGFAGCCSQPACDLDTCPEEAQEPVDTIAPTPNETDITLRPPSTESSTISTFGSPPDTPFTSENYSGRTSSTAATKPTSEWLGSVTGAATSSPSAPEPTTPTNTGTLPSGDGNEGTWLSTAAIAGISVGSTVVAMFIILIACLLIRRHRIAKRMSSAPSSSTYADQQQFAEEFMKGHSSRRDQNSGPRSNSPPRGISELP